MLLQHGVRLLVDVRKNAFSQKNGEYAGGDLRVVWVFRAVTKCVVVIVDFPEEILTIDNHLSEVMLTVWVVILHKVVIELHRSEQFNAS